jgi:hypothetical protein
MRPSGPLGCRLQHRAGAPVCQVREAELHRIGAGRLGQLVHERLDRERVEERAERT